MRALVGKVMKTIDGAMGEGGGQIFRTTLSLSMCTGVPVKIENIRAGRKKSGLLRQHLTCLRAAKEICNAKVSGDALGSQVIEFTPGKIVAGKYWFAVGSAGSTNLVFQTVLPALLCAEAVSELYLEGGTHNQSAPSFEFISGSFIPALAKMNIKIEAQLERYGFYPNGGGAWSAKVHPMNGVVPLKLLARGELVSKKAVAIGSKLPAHVLERELSYVQKKCYWKSDELVQRHADSCGPGNLLSLQVEFEGVTEVFDSVGQVGLSAERVAGCSVKDVKRYLDSKAPVAEYLCDQLLLPLVLGNGGVFRTLRPSLHTQTNIEVIQKMVDCTINVIEIEDDLFEIKVIV